MLGVGMHDRPCSVGNTNVGQVKVSVSPSGQAQDEAEREAKEWSSTLRTSKGVSAEKGWSEQIS